MSPRPQSSSIKRERPALAALILVVAAGCDRVAPRHELVTPSHGAVGIPLERVLDGQAHFFTYRYEGRNVNFFIRTDGEKTLRAHFDACYGCFKYKRGYVQEGRQVVCLACRIGYDLDTPVWEYVGACVPIPLRCRVEDSGVLLPVSALEQGARFF